MSDPDRSRRVRTFFGQPIGVGYIVFAEGWERFSFYGMQALLVLYMTGHLLQPGIVDGVLGFSQFRSALEWVFGSLSVQALASQIFGLYVGLVYFFPVLGGLLGDRLLGRTRAVVAGAILMTAGHFLMALENAFLMALTLLILGSGLLKGNLASQVGDLYSSTDTRRDAAFSMYCLAINTGAFLAPLVCGTLGELYGWHHGFGAAGVGMVVGMCVYLTGRRHLPRDRVTSSKVDRPKLLAGEGRVIAALALVIAITSLYWAAQTQVWNTYPIWLRDRVDRQLGGFDIPVTWFQSLDTFATLALAPVVISFWRSQSRRASEPRELTKIALGCLAFVAGCMLLTASELTGSTRVALFWPVLFHFTCAIAYLYIWPVTLSLVSRDAPVAVNGMMVGAYYLAIFAGGMISGWLGRFYEVMSPAAFWALHGLIVGSGTVLIFLLRRPIVACLSARTPATTSMIRNTTND